MPKRRKFKVELPKDCVLAGGAREYPDGSVGLEIHERYVALERLFALRFPKAVRKQYQSRVTKDGTILVPRWLCREVRGNENG